MMSPDGQGGMNGSGGGQPSPGGIAGMIPWWVESYKSYITAGCAVLELLCGVLTAISIFPTCIIGGVLQILAAIVILAVEAPTFVAFLSFAAPIGMFFDGKPNWMKAAAYLALAIIPCLPGCFGLFYILGFLAGLAVAAVYGAAVIGRKASRDEMRFSAAGSPTGGQPYSPTSP